MKSYDGLLQSSFMFFMQLVVLATRPSIGTLYGVTNGRCKLILNFWISDMPLFSLDPGVWAGQQLAQPALGRHHLPHRLWREAVRLQAADPTHALLPHPLCIQIPHHCHLLHIHEGKVWQLIFYFSSQVWAIPVAIMPLVIFNMWLTRRTYKLPTAPPQQHLVFCTIVGGKHITLSTLKGGFTYDGKISEMGQT